MKAKEAASLKITESLGSQLRTVREKRGLSYEEVYLETKVNIDFLKAMEADEFHRLPAQVYAKSFLRRYAEFLGLDANLLLKRYAEQYQDTTQQVLVPFKEGNLVTVSHRGTKTGTRRRFKIAVIIVLLAIAAYLGTRVAHTVKWRRIENMVSEEVPEHLSQNLPVNLFSLTGDDVFEDRQDQPGPVQESREESSLPGIVSSERVVKERLVLTASTMEDVWMRVVRDDELVFEATLLQGKTESWQAEEKYTVRIGHVKGLFLSLNGESLPLPDTYSPKTLVITENGIEQIE